LFIIGNINVRYSELIKDSQNIHNEESAEDVKNRIKDKIKSISSSEE
jgi:hypothetical protein